jgi:hypothetical protein
MLIIKAINVFWIWFPIHSLLPFLPFTNHLFPPFPPYWNCFFTAVLPCNNFCYPLACIYCSLPSCFLWGRSTSINFLCWQFFEARLRLWHQPRTSCMWLKPC